MSVSLLTNIKISHTVQNIGRFICNFQHLVRSKCPVCNVYNYYIHYTVRNKIDCKIPYVALFSIVQNHLHKVKSKTKVFVHTQTPGQENIYKCDL